MHTTRKSLITLAALLALAFLASTTAAWAQGLELGVNKEKIINGFEAELRGDYQENNGVPSRLTAELERINIPVGTPVAFCLVDSITLVKTKLGVAKVQMVGGVPVAEIELRTSDGDFVPKVTAGDKLQARQSAVAPFNPNPGCGSHLLISGKFQ